MLKSISTPAVFEILGFKFIGVSVTWRHRSRDHSIPRRPFPIGVLWKQASVSNGFRVAIGECVYMTLNDKVITIRYDTIEEINVDSKAEYTA